MTHRRTFPPRWARRRYGSTAAAPPPWLPTDEGEGCKLWVRPEGIIGLVDNDPIGTWPDDGVIGNDLIETIEAQKLTYQTNEINGYSVARSDGIDDIMEQVVSLTWDTDAVTIFMVAKFVKKNYGMFICYGNNSVGHWNFRQISTGGAISFVNANNNEGALGATDRSGAWHIFVASITANDVATVWTDNTQDATGSTGAFTISASAFFYLAKRPDGYACAMDVAEIFMLNSVSELLRQNGQNYLHTKYNIALN